MKFMEMQEILARALGEETATRACEALCQEARGEQIKIPRRFLRPEIRPGDTPHEIQQRYQVSRATAYNWVNEWKQ